MIDEITRHKIASLVDAKPSSQHDDVWDALSREAYVVGGGLLDGFVDNTNTKTLLKKTPEFLTSAGIGAALSIAKGKTGIIKLGGEILGWSLAAGFAKDLSDPARATGLSTAIENSWKSGEHLDYNRSLVKKNGGDLLFDTTLMAGGGIFGASTARVGRSNVAQLRSMLGEQARSLETHAAVLGATETRSFSERQLPSFQLEPAGPISKSSRSRQIVEGKDLPALAKEETVSWKLPNGKTIE